VNTSPNNSSLSHDEEIAHCDTNKKKINKKCCHNKQQEKEQTQKAVEIPYELGKRISEEHIQISESLCPMDFSRSFKIGVMGSAQGPAIQRQQNTEIAYELGKAIANERCILVNGACPGLPNDAAIGAKRAGGFVMGISPAFSQREHIEKYKSPIDSYDIILYTGFGLMERDILNIRASDAIIILGGGIGTLNEFTIAFDEGRLIGVVEGTDGISDHIPHIVYLCKRPLGSRIFFDKDPKTLVKKILEALVSGPRVIMEDERIVSPKNFLT
jgi:uncharacterized protein (TIGR00725 family)